MADELFRYSPGANLYGSFAQSIANSAPALVNPYGSVGGNIASVLGAGLLSGLLGYQARNEAQDSTLAANRGALQILGAKTPEERQAIAEAAPSSAIGYDVRGDLMGLTQQLSQKEALGRLDAQNQKLLRTAQLDADIEAQRKRFADSDASAPGAPGAPAAPQAMKLFADAVPLEVRKDRRYRQLVSQGVPEGRAAEQAEKELLPERLLQKSAVKKVDELRARSEKLKNITDSLSIGIAGSGATGGPGIINGPRDVASSFLAFFGNDDQRAKQDAQTYLRDAKVKISAMAKQPGEGAVSDYERKLFLLTAPGEDMTPTQNATILGRLQRLQEIESQYADFLEFAVSSGVSMTDAQKKWREYSDANPVIIQDPNNKAVYDLERKSWQDFFGITDSVAQGVAPAPQDMIQAPVAPSAPTARAVQQAPQAPAPATQIQAAPVASTQPAPTQFTREQILAAIARKQALMQAQGK